MAKIDITVEGYRCERCKHEWIPRTKDYPVICPKCKSPYWDRPKTNSSEAAEKAWIKRKHLYGESGIKKIKKE